MRQKWEGVAVETQRSMCTAVTITNYITIQRQGTARVRATKDSLTAVFVSANLLHFGVNEEVHVKLCRKPTLRLIAQLEVYFGKRWRFSKTFKPKTKTI